MIDAPGPWGSGPFTLVEGYSSINLITAIQRVRPDFVATNLITGEDRTPQVVLEANREHNSGRTAHLERVVFRNDLSAQEALDAVCDREGELDIVSEVSPGDAQRVKDSEHAQLVTIDANRMLTGVFNTYASNDAPLHDVRMREALNLAVDRHRIVAEAFAGYAAPLAALTPPWCNGSDPELEPRRRDPGAAKELADAAGWPAGRRLRIAADASLEPIAAMIAADVEDALGIDSEIIALAPEQGVPTARALVEKKLSPFWDVLLNPWFDLSSDNPIAFVHREFFGHDGGFRAGPPDPEFDRMFAELAQTIDSDRSRALAQQIDRYVYDQSKALFLCAPNALYAVNRHVEFKAYRATFELADTEVSPEHWSRRQG
ncbi:MAG: ABC transporter substrate-binding protein [Solirubrobacteraceae bacterium]